MARTTKMRKKKTPQRARRSGSRSQKSGGITVAQYENLLLGIRSLHERIDMLQADHVEIRTLAGLEMAGPEGAGNGAMVSLTFKKTSGPDNVRVTLMDTIEPVLLPFSSKATSKPRRVGANIPAKVEVNGGASVVIEVTHSSPGQISDRGEHPLTVLE